MSNPVRVFMALMASLVLSGPSFADGKDEHPGCAYEVFPPYPPNDGILFVDHSQMGRLA